MNIRLSCLGLLLALALTSCAEPPPQALGTLEWDRVTLPATASEPIVEILVRDGQVVATGDALVQLDPTRADARRQAADADVERLAQVLAALQAGARSENRDEARAGVDAAQALARNAEQQLQRTRALVKQQLLPAAQLDQAAASARAAQSELAAARAASSLLSNGSRSEDLAQAAAALDAARAQARSAAIDLARLRVRAPRAGRVDSLPFEAGDQPPVGAPLVVLLVGDAPYARIYVPEPQRAALAIGAEVTVRVASGTTSHRGRLRSIRSEPSFTPYYALTGKDVARLSYLAEVELGPDAANLPAGLPVRADWPESQEPQ